MIYLRDVTSVCLPPLRQPADAAYRLYTCTVGGVSSSATEVSGVPTVTLLDFGVQVSWLRSVGSGKLYKMFAVREYSGINYFQEIDLSTTAPSSQTLWDVNFNVTTSGVSVYRYGLTGNLDQLGAGFLHVSMSCPVLDSFSNAMHSGPVEAMSASRSNSVVSFDAVSPTTLATTVGNLRAYHAMKNMRYIFGVPDLKLGITDDQVAAAYGANMGHQLCPVRLGYRSGTGVIDTEVLGYTATTRVQSKLGIVSAGNVSVSAAIGGQNYGTALDVAQLSSGATPAQVYSALGPFLPQGTKIGYYGALGSKQGTIVPTLQLANATASTSVSSLRKVIAQCSSTTQITL